MASKERSARLVHHFIDKFHCPLCKAKMKVVENKSLSCTNNHTFDFAKQGYLNLLTRPISSLYDRKLFEARQKIITESHLYRNLHRKVSDIIHEHVIVENRANIIFDAGCGEGSHLHEILEFARDMNLLGIGVDIAKEGIRLAASTYKEAIWLVGDLANTPIADDSCQFIINILSPANYAEFKRILAPNGIVIKVVPSSNYLREIREALFQDSKKKNYENNETVALFKEQFDIVSTLNITETHTLNGAQLTNIVMMTPLGWNSTKEKIDAFVNQEVQNITVDLEILVGVNR